MKTHVYVFTYTSTETLGIGGVQAFSTSEKAKAHMKDWIEATASGEGDKANEPSDDYAQVITENGVTWTAEITNTEDRQKPFIPK